MTDALIGNTNDKDLARIKSNIISNIKSMFVPSERVTFLQVGSFYVCQLQANGLDAQDVKELQLQVIERAASLDKAQIDVGNINKP